MKAVSLIFLLFFSFDVFSEDFFQWKTLRGRPSDPSVNAIDKCNSNYDSEYLDNSSYFESPTKYVCKRKFLQANGVHWSYFSTDFYRIGTSCSDGRAFDPDLNECVNPPDCSLAKPVSSVQNLGDACYKACAYENIHTIRDFSNPLASQAPSYEYVATGRTCLPFDLTLDLVNEFTEISNEENCRNGKDICIHINEPDCIYVFGSVMCADRDPNTKDLIISDENCGIINDKLQCFPKNGSANCGYFNKEYVCIDKTALVIQTTSPDHPTNGGNGDGIITNDILDPSDITNQTPLATEVQSIVRTTYIETKTKEILNGDSTSKTTLDTVSGEGCDKEIVCSGNAITCSILRYQKKQACLYDPANLPALKAVIAVTPNTDALGTRTEDTSIIDMRELLDTPEEIIVANRMCPALPAFQIYSKTFYITLQPLCDLAGVIRFFLIFATWFSVAVLFARALINR